MAIGTRDAPVLTARLNTAISVTHPLATLSLSPSLPMQRASSQPNPSEFVSISPSQVAEYLVTPGALILDIRPTAAFNTARVLQAVSLSAPSTLLKRPAFSLEKLSQLVRTSARQRFSAWKAASKIVLYDTDSAALADQSILLGLLRKFQTEGAPHGSVVWVRGGFTAVWREAHHVVDESAFSDSDGDGESPSMPQGRQLPRSAFQQSSTTHASHRSPAIASSSDAGSVMSMRVMAANPFYDNIRQNAELAQGMTERITLRLPQRLIDRRADLPFKWLRDIVDGTEADGAEALAMQFYKIEMAEQRRLQGVMEHHSNHSFQAKDNFPYSIAAGIEKGAKNRYRNIWPFEHARVRLKTKTVEDDSDYINASFVKPIGTKKRYIATQGPLPATYIDFWTLCWEEKVPVIVMLTRQCEGVTVKCGEYWADAQYGSLRLKLVSCTGPSDEPERSILPGTGFDFFSYKSPAAAVPPPAKFSPSTAIIRRHFLISHIDHPEVAPRPITQIQYLGWPDLGVPEDPEGLLWVIGAVDSAVEDAARSASHAEYTQVGPVLLHCSAGVGRTGGYLVIDAVLDAVRREMREAAATHQLLEPTQHLAAPMDVDSVSGKVTEITATSAALSMAHGSPQAETGAHQLGRLDQPSQSPPRQAPGVEQITTVTSDSLSRLPHSTIGLMSFKPFSSESSSGFQSRADVSSASASLQPSLFDLALSNADTNMSSVPAYGRHSPSNESCDAEETTRMKAQSQLMPAPRGNTGVASHMVATTRAVSDWTVQPALNGSRLRNVFASSGLQASLLAPSPQPIQDSRIEGAARTRSGLASPLVARSSAEPPSTGRPQETFDFTKPSAVHNDDSPISLSELDEPIRQVLESMREQRMSLCQSLRQYVFVHLAILEGVLQLVDEERRAPLRMKADLVVPRVSLTQQVPPGSRVAFTGHTESTRYSLSDESDDAGLQKRVSLKRKQRSETSSPSDIRMTPRSGTQTVRR